jgi:hypothetical protein
MSAEERARHRALGPPSKGGALPLEVRRALEAVVADGKVNARALDLSLRAEDSAAQQLVDRLEHRLNHLVEVEMRAYLEAIRPVVNPTASIFANAARTATGWLDPASAAPGRKLTRCEVCRAPREDDERAKTCSYCGSSLYGDKEET